MNYYDCDIICICETWLKESVKLTAFNSVYQVFRQDRLHNNGGGILLAVKNNIPCKLVKKLTVNRCECLFVDVQCSGSEFIRYSLVYRPPDTNLLDSMELYNTLFYYLQNMKSYVLLGDFNLPDISWNDLTANSNVGREFLTLCFKIGAEQLVDFPTRLNNQLDLLLSPDKGALQLIQPEAPFCESDHVSILCHMYNHVKDDENFVLKPCFKKADYRIINAFFATIDWDVVYSNCHSSNEYWLAFKNIINTAIFNFVPFVYTRKTRSTPWFNSKLKNMRLCKQRKWRKYIRSCNIVTHANYKSSAQQFRSEFIKAKRNYEVNLFASQNSGGKFYGYIKSQTSVNTGIPCLKKSDGTIVVNDYDKASEFLQYFSSVFVDDNNVIPEFDQNCEDTLDTFSCNTRDVVKVIMKLKNSSSPGPDGITSGFLRNVLAHIASPLCKVFNKSLSEGILPEDWKIAYIIPLFKKGDPQQTTQYRPVSLTSIICKVLERIIRIQLLDYMTKNDIIPQCQHGFIPKKSTVTNLLECLDDWTADFDKKVSTDIIYLDYSKCFDKVCHSKLLFKLSRYGVSGLAYQWLRNFLTNRVQHVKVNNSISPPAKVVSGVPQGTVLGPLLFLCYSADLPKVVQHCKISIYADDTKLYKAIHNINDCQNLQEDLNRIYDWAVLWQMELNPDKTRLLTIGSFSYRYDYILSGNIIERVSSMNDVGVIIQSDLKFTKHCSNIVKKAYFVIRNIFTLLKNHNYNFYLKMYTCYVRPILEYASQVWSPLLKGNIDKIEKVQRYYSRRIVNSGDNLTYGQRMELLGLQYLEDRRMKSDLVLFFKKIKEKTVINIQGSYSIVNSERGHSFKLYKYYCRTDKRKLFWVNRIVNDWNHLNEDIVNSTSISSFKEKLNNVYLKGRGSIYCE